MEIIIADEKHAHFSEQIAKMIEQAAQHRGTGIAKRTPEYISSKIMKGDSIIAITNGEVAGFCYIETWGHGKFVANSGLIVSENFRGLGLASKIKERSFQLSREKYPESKLFGITTSLAVLKINSNLGYKPVTFSELTDDESFWKGCQGCVNYDILQRTNRVHCLCTGMLFKPGQKEEVKKLDKSQRWDRFKAFLKTMSPINLLNKSKESKKLNENE